jgi:hypothetical protein
MEAHQGEAVAGDKPVENEGKHGTFKLSRASYTRKRLVIGQ